MALGAVSAPRKTWVPPVGMIITTGSPTSPAELYDVRHLPARVKHPPAVRPQKRLRRPQRMLQSLPEHGPERTRP